MSRSYWPAPAAAGPALGVATLRATPEDFQVYEIPSWQPSGSGEHDVLLIQKRGANTQWVAAQLAAFAECSRRDVSYAGLKDRQALTIQWFSVHRPGRSIDWSSFEAEGVTLLEVAAHHRKLKIGALAGNRFRL
ncbi:MAG: tRNA pseudouridine(13) synthase TruD, partial [Pseudomonadota bacterium]